MAKYLTRFVVVMLFCASGLYAQCQWQYNPFTRKLDCTTPAGGPNATAVSVPAVTSLTVTHNLNTLNITFNCFTTDTGATVAVTSISGQTLNAVTLNFSSTANVQCNVNGTGGTGPPGATGSAGAAGAAGSSVLNGTSTPPSNGTGANGDFYLNTSTSCIYGPKSAGAWPGSCVSLIGPTGATGAAGSAGPAGSTGAAGPQGAAGKLNMVPCLATTFSATPTFNLATGGTGGIACNVIIMTLTGNVSSSSFSPTINSGDFIGFQITQDGTGSWTFAAPSGFSQFVPVAPDANVSTNEILRWDGTIAWLQDIAITSETPSIMHLTQRAAKASLPPAGVVDVWADSTAGPLQLYTSSNTLGLPWTMVQSANSGCTTGTLGDYIASTGLSHCRTIVSGDIPNNAANTSGTAALATAADHTPTLCGAGNYPSGVDASWNATGCTAAGGSATGGGVYTTSFTLSTSPTTITQATHGQGTCPMVKIFDGNTAYRVYPDAMTLATNGDLVITGGSSESVNIYISATNGVDPNACSIFGSPGSSTVVSQDVHGFNTTLIEVQAWDSASPRAYIIPDNVSIDATYYTVTVNFAAATAGMVVLSRGNAN